MAWGFLGGTRFACVAAGCGRGPSQEPALPAGAGEPRTAHRACGCACHYMLCGALLRVWGRIAAVMADVCSSYLQIVRLKTKDRRNKLVSQGTSGLGEVGSLSSAPGP